MKRIMKHDKLAVSERQLQPPTKPKAISLNAFLKTSAKCEQHGNPMAAGRLDCRAVPGATGGVAVVGEIYLSFMGCKCRYAVPVK
jgi:hypothetical protein